MAREVKQIEISVLRQQVADGWKREQIAEHYGLTIEATKRLLREAGLRLRSTRYPVYQIVGMEEVTTNPPEDGTLRAAIVEEEMSEEEFEEFQDELISELEEASGEITTDAVAPATEDVNW